MPLEQIAAGDVFVAEADGAIVGFAVLIAGAGLDGELDGLFVDPSTRRRGVGKLLIEHCITIARNREFRGISVVANSHAEAFYLACGFSQTGTCQTRFGAALLMRLDLRPLCLFTEPDALLNACRASDILEQREGGPNAPQPSSQ